MRWIWLEVAYDGPKVCAESEGNKAIQENYANVRLFAHFLAFNLIRFLLFNQAFGFRWAFFSFF